VSTPILLPAGTTAGPKVEKLELKVRVLPVVSCYLWNFLIGPPRLEGEMQTHESPVPVPLAGKEIKDHPERN
jgi:hypothetical protein